MSELKLRKNPNLALILTHMQNYGRNSNDKFLSYLNKTTKILSTFTFKISVLTAKLYFMSITKKTSHFVLKQEIKNLRIDLNLSNF